MALTLTPITELDAVNAMLEMLNSAPVNSLPDSGVSEAYLARSILHRVSREIQGQGLSFNTDRRYELQPDINGFIELPSTALRFDAFYHYQKFVPRLDTTDGKIKLYDTQEHTFVFTSPVLLDIVWFFPWAGLPDHVRNYVYVRAARQFQSRFQANTDMFQLTEEDETRARAEFMSAELQQDDETFFHGEGVYHIVSRRV